MTTVRRAVLDAEELCDVAAGCKVLASAAMYRVATCGVNCSPITPRRPLTLMMGSLMGSCPVRGYLRRMFVSYCFLESIFGIYFSADSISMDEQLLGVLPPRPVLQSPT
jgi:hypothetical protein